MDCVLIKSVFVYSVVIHLNLSNLITKNMNIKLIVFTIISLSVLIPINGQTKNLMDDFSKFKKSNENSITYIKASIPTKIFRCMTKFNLIRCMKSFILQRMEYNQKIPITGNITADFLNKILSENINEPNSIDEFYLKLKEKELNKRISMSFKEFFNNREIKMNLMNGMMVNVVPSNTNLLNFSLKKKKSLKIGRGKNKHQYLIELGLPALFMPVVLLGSFIPMMLPAIKMATLFSGAINNAALVGALMYLARTAALENEQQNTVFYTPGSTGDYRH